MQGAYLEGIANVSVFLDECSACDRSHNKPPQVFIEAREQVGLTNCS